MFARKILGSEYNSGSISNLHSSGNLSIDGEIYAAEFDANAPTVNFSSANTFVATNGLSLQLEFSEGLTAWANDAAAAVLSQFTI